MPRQCSPGFIQSYLDYTTGQQSPQRFHTWAAVGIISAALGRRVWMGSSGKESTESSYYILYPNLYDILVSPSGVGMKSTALDIGVDLLEYARPDMNIIKGKITSTRLVSRLVAAQASSPNGTAEILIKAREFKVFTKGVMQQSTLIEDLTDLYDCGPFDYETEHGMRQRINKPYVVIMAASTPEWLTGGQAGDLMSGGFGARIIPACLTQDERDIAWAEKTETSKELEPRLVNDLNEIGQMEGSFFVTQAGKAYFEKWYKTRRASRKYLDSRLDGYYSKKHDLIRKLSMIVSASISSERVVDEKHIEVAMRMLEENERTLLVAYAGATTSPEAKYRDQIIARIRDWPEEEGITHSRLAQFFYHALGSKGLRMIVNDLISEQVVKAIIVDTDGRKRVTYKCCLEE